MFSETVCLTKQQDNLQQLFNHNHGGQQGSHQVHNSSSFINRHAVNIASNNYKGKPEKVGANEKQTSSVIPPVNNYKHNTNQGNHNGIHKPTDLLQNRANSAIISQRCETNKQPNSVDQRCNNFLKVTPNESNSKNHQHQPEPVHAWGRSSTENPSQMYFGQISNDRTSINARVNNMDKIMKYSFYDHRREERKTCLKI